MQADEATGKIVLSVASGLIMRPWFKPYASARFGIHLQTRFPFCAVRCLDRTFAESALHLSAPALEKRKRRTFFLMYTQIAFVT